MNEQLQLILEDPAYQKTLKKIAKNHNLSYPEVLESAEEALSEMYTQQHPVLHSMGVQMAEYIVGRAYEKVIDVNIAEVKELAKLMRRHSVAFVMTHKTYIDMFVLGITLARYGLKIPYIFAGINMAFAGIGQLGKRAGAIFIRRSFKDDEIYKATLRHFIAHLVKNKEHFMWALEGTRSRTGKLVWPKMGILKYIQEAELNSKQEVKYIPISIVYDLIPDVEDMTLEGRGKAKTSESLSWFLGYVKKMGEEHGKISLRIGLPAVHDTMEKSVIPTDENNDLPSISKFAFGLTYGINYVTPVTTGSLICIALLSKFSLTKRSIEAIVFQLMEIIEAQKPDALIDRNKNLSERVQRALNLFKKARIVQLVGEGVSAKYAIVPENFLKSIYYANMATHHLYHRAFIELALMKVHNSKGVDPRTCFWEEIMTLRDLFKFEFFYSNKSEFSDQIEAQLNQINPKWRKILTKKNSNIGDLLKDQQIYVSHVILKTLVEAYKVVAYSFKTLEPGRKYSEAQLMRACLFYGEELHWKGKIHRVESVSKPFISNGIRLAKNRNLLPTETDPKLEKLDVWLQELNDIGSRMDDMLDELPQPEINIFATKKESKLIPGSYASDASKTIVEGEDGKQIAAFFDLDRTLISEFSAKQFIQARIKSRKMPAKELASQFIGAMVYTMGNKNFASLAALSAKGVGNMEERILQELGEEVYLKSLSKTIYPESRALVEAHMAKGHTVAIVSAATPYQVEPIARDLGIKHIMCTRMEVAHGKFTGKIVEPACWGEGKAIAGRNFAAANKIDLDKSYFYTDSYEDLPLLEIVGHPKPVNPDKDLSAHAMNNDWSIYRFNDDGRPNITNVFRTGITLTTVGPAIMSGLASGILNQDWNQGKNSMMAMVGDLGTRLAGIKLVVKNEHFIWNARPAVFIFNHQSNVDLMILAKLLRKDAIGIAKKELEYSPLGPVFKAAGMIFIDRSNRDKAIEAMKPAVDALKNGTSIGLAPEGTRSYDYTLGKFKKGAFHLAMQAKVPIVPIVIKNAHDAMPRGSNVIRPAVVEVAILKPIPTKKWKLEDLNKNIDKVRNLYLEELGQINLTKVKKKKKKKKKKK